MPSSNDKTSRNSAEELLPWLVNETLDGDEKKQLEKAVDNSQELQNEKELLGKLRQEIKQQEFPNVALEFEWQKLHKQIASEKKPAKQNSNLIARWRMIALAASLLLVIQSTTIMIPTEEDGYFEPLSSDSETSAPKRTLLKIRFIDTATQIEVQKLLRKHQLEFVSGPTSAGLYQVSTNNEPDKIVKLLQQRTDIIAHVQYD